LSAAVLASKLAPLLPIIVLNWAPVVVGLPVTSKVPDSRSVPRAVSLNKNDPA
jgi:hypothetical protein